MRKQVTVTVVGQPKEPLVDICVIDWKGTKDAMDLARSLVNSTEPLMVVVGDA